MMGVAPRGRAGWIVALSSVLLGLTFVSAQQPPSDNGAPKKVWQGVFTSAQVPRGKASYDGYCARCHGVELTGGTDGGPALKGAGFLAHWDGDTLGSLFVKIRDTMPANGAGTITEDVKAEVLAYILDRNGFPPGTTELRADPAALDEVRMAQRGVWDGVFTAAQADRGQAAAGQGRCTGCHGPALAGTDRAPALKGPAFLANWENGSVNQLFTKIRDTMPPANADQLPPATKVDVVAFLLRENGFPAGSVELSADKELLDAVQIVKKSIEGDGPSNFTLVQVVGCLAGDAQRGWALTDAGEPAAVRDPVPSASALTSAVAKPLGKQTLRLVSVNAAYHPEAAQGRKVEARGLLYREPGYADLNLTSLRLVGESCPR